MIGKVRILRVKSLVYFQIIKAPKGKYTKDRCKLIINRLI